jgi:hypothetical protein
MNLSAAKYLLKNKAEVNAADSAGHTALYCVAVDGHPSFELAETLMQKGGKLGKKRPNPLARKASESQRKVRTLMPLSLLRGLMRSDIFLLFYRETPVAKTAVTGHGTQDGMVLHKLHNIFTTS